MFLHFIFNVSAGRMCPLRHRMAKESTPASAAAPKPVRFREKHAYNTPSARELLEGERPLQPTPGVRPPALPCPSLSSSE